MTASASRPAFDALPTNELGLRQAWDAFDADDELGTLGSIASSDVRGAAALVIDGTVWNLSLPLDAIDPPLYGRERLRHTVVQVDRNTWDDRLDSFSLQGSTHWDGLRHIQARELGHFGGRTDASQIVAGGGPLGIDRWARRGIAGRGVLLDVASILEEDPAYDPFAECAVPVSTLEAAAARQGVDIREHDVLCLRFGWLARYKRLDAAGKAAVAASRSFVGLDAGEATARWLWDSGIAAVAADNPGLEVSPGDRAVGSLHRRLIPLLGMALGEFFDLDNLAAACASDSRWDFLIVSAPLHLIGGVGSPANAVVIR